MSPKTAFIFETNNDSYRKIRKKKYVQHPNGEIARKAFFMLADKHKAGVWDKFSIMGGLGSMAKWEKADLAKKDKVHFKTAGYQLLGDMFYKALMQAYFEHIANLPAEDPVVAQAKPVEVPTIPPTNPLTKTATAIQAKVAAPAPKQTSVSTPPAAAKAATSTATKTIPPTQRPKEATSAKAEVPMPQVLKQTAHSSTQSQIQVPLKPEAQNKK